MGCGASKQPETLNQPVVVNTDDHKKQIPVVRVIDDSCTKNPSTVKVDDKHEKENEIILKNEPQVQPAPLPEEVKQMEEQKIIVKNSVEPPVNHSDNDNKQEISKDIESNHVSVDYFELTSPRIVGSINTNPDLSDNQYDPGAILSMQATDSTPSSIILDFGLPTILSLVKFHANISEKVLVTIDQTNCESGPFIELSKITISQSSETSIPLRCSKSSRFFRLTSQSAPIDLSNIKFTGTKLPTPAPKVIATKDADGSVTISWTNPGAAVDYIVAITDAILMTGVKIHNSGASGTYKLLALDCSSVWVVANRKAEYGILAEAKLKGIDEPNKPSEPKHEFLYPKLDVVEYNDAYDFGMPSVISSIMAMAENDGIAAIQCSVNCNDWKVVAEVPVVMGINVIRLLSDSGGVGLMKVDVARFWRITDVKDINFYGVKAPAPKPRDVVVRHHDGITFVTWIYPFHYDGFVLVGELDGKIIDHHIHGQEMEIKFPGILVNPQISAYRLIAGKTEHGLPSFAI
ncbi:hypothetical protein HK096_000790 [Nowakowskiella sp. JEL0078]|nr:hypothetical protein HK096_000790 [Nowakowskiella sp. JEL0078]